MMNIITTTVAQSFKKDLQLRFPIVVAIIELALSIQTESSQKSTLKLQESFNK